MCAGNHPLAGPGQDHTGGSQIRRVSSRPWGHTLRTTLLLTLLAGCTAEVVFIRQDLEDTSFEAKFSYQPRDRILVTASLPEEDICAGVMLGRGIGDGIPGQNLDLPDDWSLEMAYRSDGWEGCHERFPQAHRVEQAYAGVGVVEWDARFPELPPLEVDLDVKMAFERWPQELVVVAQGVAVQPPGTP